jgi:ribonucleoside-diphosphate reductase alpha chain
MDCDTTGVEPDFSLVKFKKLAGGGYFKIVNQSVPQALRRLGYSEAQTAEIVAYVSGTNTLLGAPHINRQSLRAAGMNDDDIAKVEKALPGVFELSLAFAPWVIGKEAYDRLGITADTLAKPGFNLLSHLGYSAEQVSEANDVIVGRMTIEGAPHLRLEHYSVFDCANRCGRDGKRFLEARVEGRGAVPRRLQGLSAAVEHEQEVCEEGGRSGRGAGARRCSPQRRRRGAAAAAAAQWLARAHAAEAPRVHAGGAGGRAQGVLAHR